MRGPRCPSTVSLCTALKVKHHSLRDVDGGGRGREDRLHRCYGGKDMLRDSCLPTISCDQRSCAATR